MKDEVMHTIKELQEFVGAFPDGKWGPRSQAALQAILDQSEWAVVRASTFADPADVASFKRCIAKGNSEQTCFAVGDNGIGKWGDDTSNGPPMCALPPEDIIARWGSLSAGKHQKVIVMHEGREVECIVGDIMPHKWNIKNGCGLDMNPALCKAIGHTPPDTVKIAWRWA